MLNFLKQTFNMHESLIHSLLTHFPFISYNDTDFWSQPISRTAVLLRYPLLRRRRLKQWT